MRRRGFIGSTIGATAAWPFAARAQQPGTMPIVGFLHSAASGQVADLVAAFQSGLKEGGFIPGQNIAIEYRWADNDNGRLPALAADLVNKKVDIIAAAGGDRSAMAAKRATSIIPIVAVIGGDPVAEGLVVSLARPGGNLTGVSFLTASLTVKRLELLLEVAPQAKVIGLLVNSKNPQSPEVIDDMRRATQTKGLTLHVGDVGTEAEADDAFATMDKLHVGALVIQADPYFNNIRRRLTSLAARYSLPATMERHAFVEDGGLISYGTSLPDVYRRIGIYCAKVLKGARPADLPVEQPTKFELWINLKTAKALGIEIPPRLRLSADEVIE
jgi:putative ABC transport system substrate-binding protein